MQFGLPNLDHLVNAPQLPTDLASCLEQTEDATDEQDDTQSLPTPWSYVLLYDLRGQCQRGRATSGTLQLTGEPDPSPMMSHLPGLQLQVEPNQNTTPCQTQWNSQMTGSGHMLGG